MDSLYDRMTALEGGQLGTLRSASLVIAARGPVARCLSVSACCIGIERQVLVTPDVHEGLDIADATMRHHPRAYVDVVAPTMHRSPPSDALFALDVGDPAARLSYRPENRVVGFAEKSGAVAFGQLLGAVAEGALGRPVAPCAEIATLTGELLASLCGMVNAYRDLNRPMTTMDDPPVCATIATGSACGPMRGPRRIYVGGLGGAIAHQWLQAVGLDAHLTRALAHPDSVIVGADDGQVEESNRSRQIGYRYQDVDRPKASATRDWLGRGPLKGTRVVALDEPVDRRHFEEHGPFDVVVSSVDSWGARRTLADLVRAYRVPILLSAGSSFFGGFERLVRAGTACVYRHGVEQLDHRADSGRRSCMDAPEPSSLIPQAILAGLAARDLRELWLGQPVDPCGSEVELLCRNRQGLSYGQGRLLNAECPCEAA